jgi:predicted HicB family RNase H-like nuclease
MSKACFYTGSNYNGDSECLPRGTYNNVKYDDRYTSAKIPKGLVAFLYEHPNFDGERLKLSEDTPKFTRNDDKVSSIQVLPDCDNPQYIWESECNFSRNVFPELDTKRADFCNANRTNALSQKCMTWCNENKGKCALLNKGIACKRYNIPDDQCTDDKILSIENDCVTYGLIDANSKTTTSRSIYQCNADGIALLLKKCKEYELSGPECTAAEIENAATAKLFEKTTQQLVDTLDKQAQLNQEQRDKATTKLAEFLETSQQRSEETIASLSEAQQAESNKQIDRAYALFDKVAKENKPLQRKPDYTQTYIIIGLVSFILSILLVVVFSLMPNKK